MKNREKTIQIVLVGVFAAVLAVLSQISIPLPSGIPVTLQTFAGLKAKHRPAALLFGALGLAACHLFGTVQFAVVSGMGPLESFLVASAPYLIKDAVSVAAAYGIAAALQHALRKNGLDLAA